MLYYILIMLCYLFVLHCHSCCAIDLCCITAHAVLSTCIALSPMLCYLLVLCVALLTQTHSVISTCVALLSIMLISTYVRLFFILYVRLFFILTHVVLFTFVALPLMLCYCFIYILVLNYHSCYAIYVYLCCIISTHAVISTYLSHNVAHTALSAWVVLLSITLCHSLVLYYIDAHAVLLLYLCHHATHAALSACLCCIIFTH